MWYENSIDESYTLAYEEAGYYIVRDNEGFLNIVLKKDGRVIYDRNDQQGTKAQEEIWNVLK